MISAPRISVVKACALMAISWTCSQPVMAGILPGSSALVARVVHLEDDASNSFERSTEISSEIAPSESVSGLPHSKEGDDRLKRAEVHFNNGRDWYFRGDTGAAHKEFDAAVDALLSAPESLPDHARLERKLEELCDLIYRFDVEKLGAGQS